MKGELSRIVIQPDGNMIILDSWAEIHGPESLPTLTGQNVTPQKATQSLPVTHVGLHYGEEYFLSGGEALVAIYFAQCNLRCRDCTNDPKWPVTNYSAPELFSTIVRFLYEGARGITFVSPTLYYFNLLPVFDALNAMPKPVPIIYNCGGFESDASISLVAPLIDVFQPDFKAATPAALRERRLPDQYPEQFMKILPVMLRDRPLKYYGDQLVRGVTIRHLMIPDHPEELVSVLELLSPFADDIVVNVMTHYYVSDRHKVVNVPVPEIPRSLATKFRTYVDGKEKAL